MGVRFPSGSTMKKSSKKKPLKASRIVIARGDDWEGVYLDGELQYEDHTVKVSDLIRLGLLKATVVNVSEEELERHGCQLPDNFNDLKHE